MKYVGYMLRKQFLIPAIAIVVVVAVMVFVPQKKQDNPPPPEKPIPVTVLKVAKSRVRDMLYLPAVVEPERVVQVAAEVAGRIESYAGLKDSVAPDGNVRRGPESAGKVDEGIRVRASSPLLYLNTDILRPEFERADATYRLALRELERIQSLRRTNAATTTELDRAKTQARTAKASMQLAQERLKRAVITAPIPGIVDRMYVEEGDYVTAGKPVADIVDISTAKIVFDVPEKDIDHFRSGTGRRTIVRIRDTGREISGTITYIGARADKDALTTPMKISVNNSSGELHSGQILKAEILRRTVENAVMVPLKSIIAFEEGGRIRHAVYVVEDGTAVLRFVKMDLTLLRGDEVLVRSGLEEGEALIVEGQRQVGPGQAVEIIKTDKPASTGG